jgi:hypothetical protein
MVFPHPAFGAKLIISSTTHSSPSRKEEGVWGLSLGCSCFSTIEMPKRKKKKREVKEKGR